MIQNMVCVNNDHLAEDDELILGRVYKVDLFANGMCDVRNDDLSIKIADTGSYRFKSVERYNDEKRRNAALIAFQQLSIDQQEAALSLPVSNTGEWQPIETAPKDGTPILGWNSTFGARETKSITYLPGSPGHADGRTDRWWNWEEMHRVTRWHPTHWMPLPEAPL